MAEEVVKYYEKDGIVVRRSKRSDIDYLKSRLRESDVEEIKTSHNHDSETALKLSLEKSIFCCTIENGHPIGMFGICPESILGDSASVWFLASNDIYKIKKRFLKNSKYFIKKMLGFYPYLYNYVDDRNKDSINWLKFCGATFEEEKPFGVDGLPFRYFYFRRKSCANQ